MNEQPTSLKTTRDEQVILKDLINHKREVFDSIAADAKRKASKTLDAVEAKRWHNAIDKAVTELDENPFLSYDRQKNELLICSSTSGRTYSSNGICQCEAFLVGMKTRHKPFPCFHRSLARLLRLFFEATEQPKSLKEEMDNAVYCRPPQTRKVEKIGGIRI